jgi:hypothetical protein
MREEHLEVRRRHGPTLLERLRWHVGSIVAALLGVLLVLQLLGVIGAPSDHSVDAVTDIRRAIGRVRDDVATRAFPMDERLKAVDERIAELRTTFRHHPTPVEGLEGITYPPSYLSTLKPGESNEIRFHAPIDLVATAEAGGVDLKWAEAADNNVKVATFEVFRKGPGDSEATTLQKVEGSIHAFRDSQAKPGHDYEYTVQAVAADPDIANTPRGRSPHSAPASVRAVADFKIEIVDHKDGVATLKVSKWHEASWRDRVFEVKEGDPIGAVDQALGIDFSTGRTLVKLAVETSEVPVTRDELVFDAKGRVVIEGGAPKRVTVATVEIRRKTLASISGGALPDEVLVLEKT